MLHSYRPNIETKGDKLIMCKKELLQRMKDCSWTCSSLALALGISPRTMYRRLHGEGSFRLWQVLQLCELLEIRDLDEKCHIFLNPPSHF